MPRPTFAIQACTSRNPSRDNAPGMTRNSTHWLGPLLAILVAQIAVSFLSRLAPTLAPALAAHLHWSVSDIGLLSSITVVGSAIFTLVGLPLVLRAGPIRSLQTGLVVGAVGTLLYALPWAAGAVVGSILIGLAAGPQATAGSDVLRRHAPAGSQNLLFSIKQAGVPLGGVLGGLFMPMLVNLVGLTATFCLCAGLAIVTGLAMQAVRRELDATRDPKQAIHPRLLLSIANLRRPLRSLADDVHLLRLSAVGGFLALGQAVWFTFLISHLVLHLGISLVAAGALFALMQIVSTVGRPAMGALADRWSALAILKASCIGSALATVTLALVTPQWPYWAVLTLMVVGGCTVSSWNGVQIAQVARFARPGTIGESITGSTLIVFVGNVAGPALFVVIDALGGDFRIGFVVSALCTVAGLIPLAKLPHAPDH